MMVIRRDIHKCHNSDILPQLWRYQGFDAFWRYAVFIHFMTITIIDWFSWIYAGLDDFNVLDDMHHLLIITLLSSIVWIYSRFNHLTYLDDIHTSYTFNTHHLWLISRIRTRFRQYPRINYFGNLWRYHGFTDIDARYHWVVHFAFDDDIQELVIFDDDWHLNIWLILLILSTFPHSSVLHAIWWYRSYFSNWWCDDIQH